MNRSCHALLLGSALGLSALALGCGSGSSGKAPGVSAPVDLFLVVRTVPAPGAVLYLNQTLQVEFTQEVDLATVDFNSFQFAAFDPNDNHGAEAPVRGEFRYLVDQGAANRRVIEFVPAFPTNESYDDGGFRPGYRYEVGLDGGENARHVIRSLAGRGLDRPHELAFSTHPGRTPEELFFCPLPGGPRRLVLAPSGPIQRLNFFLGGDYREILLVFDRPLNPAPSHFNQDRIYLEYRDPQRDPGGMTRIAASLRLVRNLPELAEVSLTPIGLLPSNAAIRVIVSADLQGIAGRSNQGDPAYDPLFGGFQTEAASALQYDAIVEEFANPELHDLEAAHREPLADWRDGRLRAAFSFRGSAQTHDFEPSVPEVILNTDFTQVVPKQGVPYSVSGGVFEFRNVTIPQGVHVRGQGTHPLVFLVTGAVHVHGHLTVDGGHATTLAWGSTRTGPGDRPGLPSDPLVTFSTRSPGGVAHCGGGRGGAALVSASDSTPRGEDGYGPFDRPGGGGKGGHSGFGGTYARGAGGGGGSFTTQGDPTYGVLTFQQQTGQGGDGAGIDAFTRSGAPRGAKPGASPFVDSDPTNDFLGRDVRVVQGRDTVILGELRAPIGGQGGGGGGAHIPGSSFPTGPTFYLTDRFGGGGGAGGGVLIIEAIGRVVVHATGRITADGGDGSGGDQANSNTQGGGGAGGSGGMIVIQSASGIEIVPRGGQAPLLHALSADGGVGRNGSFSGGEFASKYPPRSVGNPGRGGFGGLGLIQLMAPDAGAIRFDSANIKPAPVLLPSDFGHLSRARSRWIDTGATARQSERPGDPRYLDPSAEPGKFGPEYRFAGLLTSGPRAGYLDYRTVPGPIDPLGWVHRPELASGTLAAATPADAGRFHLATAQGAPFGATNRLRGALLQVDRKETGIGEWRVLGNTQSTLFLCPLSESAFTPELAGSPFQVLAHHVDLWTADRPGLPLQADAQGAFPRFNLRIGFAAAAALDAQGNPIDRYPPAPDTFVHDLETPGAREAFWKDAHGKPLARPLLMFEVLFNLAYDPSAPHIPRPGAELSPGMPLPELRTLIVPFRF